jgi:hypothetical protein
MTTVIGLAPLPISLPYWSFKRSVVVLRASGNAAQGTGELPLLVLVSDIATDVITGGRVVVVVDVVVGGSVVVVEVVVAPSQSEQVPAEIQDVPQL